MVVGFGFWVVFHFLFFFVVFFSRFRMFLFFRSRPDLNQIRSGVVYHFEQVMLPA